MYTLFYVNHESVIYAAFESTYLQINLIDVSLQLNIILRWEGMVILRCRPEIYYFHVECFYWMGVRRAFGRDCSFVSKLTRAK